MTDSKGYGEGGTLYSHFQTWLAIAGYRDQRRFLEAHLALLEPRVETWLEVQAAQDSENEDRLHDRLTLLREVRRRGSSVKAVQEAFVDLHGGFTLNLPEWLEE